MRAPAVKLAGWAAILAVPTTLFGLYGMNFQGMPELHSPYGYPAVMAAVAAAMTMWQDALAKRDPRSPRMGITLCEAAHALRRGDHVGYRPM